MAEGERIIATMLEHKALKLYRLYVGSDYLIRIPDWVPEEKICKTDKSYIQQISMLSTPTSIVGIFELPDEGAFSLEGVQKVIYLDDVQDPGNLGTIIRIADWYGVGAVVRSKGSADFYASKVIQASMGSIGHVLNGTVAREAFQDVFSQYYKVGALLTSDGNKSGPISQPVCLIIGNEGNGISPEVAAGIDRAISIPGAESRVAESLNAGVAAGILCNMLFGQGLQ